eukprot:1068608_1
MSFLKWLLLITVFVHHQPLNHALSAQDSTNFWKAVKSNVLNANCDMEPLLAAVLGMDWRTIEYVRAQSADPAFRDLVLERIKWEEMLAMSYISILQSLNIAIDALNVPFDTINLAIDLINMIPLNLGISMPHLDITVAINFALHGLFDAIPELAGFDLPDFKLPSMDVDGLLGLNYDLQLALGKWTGVLLEHRDHFKDDLVRKARDASTWLPQFWRPMIEDIVGILNDVGLFGSVTSAIINQTGLAVIWGGNIQILYNGAKISLNKGYGFAMNLEGRYELIEMRGIETEFKLLEIPTMLGTFCSVYLIKDIDEFVNKQRKYGAGVRLSMPSKEDSMVDAATARRRLLSVCDPSSDPSIGYYDQCFDLQQEYDDDTICASHASRTSTFTTDEKKRYKKNKGLLDKVWKQAKTYMGPGWRITYDLMKKAQMFGKSGEPLALTLGIQGNVESFAIEDVFSFSCDSIAFDMEPRPFNWTVYISRNKFAKFDEFADGMVDFELSEFSPARRRLQSYDFGDVSVHRFDGNDPLFVYPSNQLNDWIWRNQGSLGSDYDLNYTESACDNDADIIDVDGVNSLCEWGDNLNFTLNIAGGATKYSAVSFEIYIYKTAESTVNDECVGAGSAGILKLIINDNIELVSNSVADLEHKWTHVVFMDNDLYINKVNVGSLTETTQAPVTSDILKRVQVFGDFIACVSSAQVFNRSLSASEIDELHDTFTINTSPEAKVIDKHMKEKGFSQGIDDFFEDPINKFIDIFDDIFKIGFKAMKQVGEELFNAMKEGIMDVISKVTGVFKEITDAFDTLLDKLNVIYAVKKMLQGINILLEDVASNIGQAADGIKTAQKQLQNAMDKITNSLVQIVDMPWFPSKIKVCVSSHCDKIKVPKYFKKQIKKELTKVAKGIKLKVLLKPVFKILKQIRKYLKHMKSGIKLISKRVQKAIDALKHFEDDVGTDDVVATNTTITSHCDNQQTISMSEDGGNSFSVIGLESDNSNFHNPWSYTIPRLTQAKAAHTVFKFSCKNMGGPGGFIASVHHDDAVYSTTNPIDNGYFSIVSSASSPLVYTRNGGSPWYATSDKIASDAHWIWDGSTTVGTTLQFDFSLSEVRKVFLQCKHELTVSLSIDGGFSFNVIATNDDIAWNSAYESKTWSYSLTSLNNEQIRNTVLKFSCKATVYTGFIASVYYGGKVYSTSPRAGDGAFTTSSAVTYSRDHGSVSTPTIDKIAASDAFWVWPVVAADPVEFVLDLGAVIASAKPKYYFGHQRLIYMDAKYHCMLYFGAPLATIHSINDNINVMESMNNSDSVCIGRYNNKWDDGGIESEWNNYAKVTSPYQVTSHCDNVQTISLSTDGGNTFTVIGAAAANDDWHDPFLYIGSEATADTVLRFMCENNIVSSAGGFIATVSVDDHQYSTSNPSNPLDAGYFEFVSSTPSTVSTFSYASKTSAPWGITTASIASDAFWIWDATPDASRTTKSMTFDFHVSADMLPAQKDAWIGYQTKPTIAEFGAWCDGSTDNYTNWANTPPSPATGKGCFIQADGKWEDSDSGNTKPFVCDIVGDYVIVDQSKPFDDAQTYCKTTYGTSLASVHTASQNQFLYDLKQKQSESNDIWIGLRKQSADARHWFVDGTDHWDSAFFWDDVSPDRDDGCAVMKVDGTWNDVSCATPYRFACNVKPHVPYMFVDLKVSSSEAADHCNKTFNTALATIANRYQNDILSDLIGTDHVWIGLRRTNFVTFPIDLSKALDVLESGQNSWIWMEQSNKIYDTEWNVALDNISFTNWESGYPEDVFTCTAKTNAFMKGGSGGEWKNGCTSNRKFACNNPVEHSDVQMDDTTGDGESQYDDHFELVLETENGGLDIGYNDFMLKFIYPMGEIEERDMWIIKRECLDCVYTYEIIYYRRYTVDSSTSYWHPANIYGFMKDKWESPNNVMGVNFNIYSTYEDAINDNRDNAWKYCNTFDVTGVAAFGDCAPSLSEYVPNQWNGVNGKDASFYIHRKKPVERDVKRIKNIWSIIKRVGGGSAADASPPLIDRRDEASNDSPLINRRDEPSHEVYSYYDYYVVSIVGFITGCVFVYVVMYLCDCLEKKKK